MVQGGVAIQEDVEEKVEHRKQISEDDTLPNIEAIDYLDIKSIINDETFNKQMEVEAQVAAGKGSGLSHVPAWLKQNKQLQEQLQEQLQNLSIDSLLSDVAKTKIEESSIKSGEGGKERWNDMKEGLLDALQITGTGVLASPRSESKSVMKKGPSQEDADDADINRSPRLKIVIGGFGGKLAEKDRKYVRFGGDEIRYMEAATDSVEIP